MSADLTTTATPNRGGEEWTSPSSEDGEQPGARPDGRTDGRTDGRPDAGGVAVGDATGRKARTGRPGETRRRDREAGPVARGLRPAGDAADEPGRWTQVAGEAATTNGTHPGTGAHDEAGARNKGAGPVTRGLRPAGDAADVPGRWNEAVNEAATNAARPRTGAHGRTGPQGRRAGRPGEARGWTDAVGDATATSRAHGEAGGQRAQAPLTRPSGLPTAGKNPDEARPQGRPARRPITAGRPGEAEGWNRAGGEAATADSRARPAARREAWAPPATATGRRAPVLGVRRRAKARREGIEGVLLGMAAGDAAGWPAARHRAARMPEWTRRLTRELDTFAEENATTTLPVPIALNQPPEPLRLGPSDDAEWAVFTAEALLAAAGPLFRTLAPERRLRAAVDQAWNALASQVAAAAARAPEVESAVLPLRARISVRAGLGNLATGLRPPATGHDNPHYFDDAACVRAAVLALVHPGDPQAAATLAEFDARYTQDGDGVHGARAMAAAVAAALGGASAADAVEAALAQLPPATEIGRNARHAVQLARTATTAFELVPLLEHQIVDHVYSYGIAAAETVPVALALALAARGDMTAAVPAAVCLSRVADSAPALAGALTGALGGGGSVPATWRTACRTLAGCALPRLAGTDLVELAGLLAATELTTPGGQFRHDTSNSPHSG